MSSSSLRMLARSNSSFMRGRVCSAIDRSASKVDLGGRECKDRPHSDSSARASMDSERQLLKDCGEGFEHQKVRGAVVSIYLVFM